MKKISFLLSAAFVLGFLSYGSVFLDTMAKDSVSRAAVYYKSIEIQSGDTLWDIASQYAPGVDLSIPEYIDCLRQMNHLEGDTIHVGCHLTVMYQAPEDS